MKILVVGSGGREHAICWALEQTSHDKPELFCAPGNGGIAQVAECVAIKADEQVNLASFVEKSGIDLTVVGPEAPLADGLVDVFEQRGLRIVGPASAAARLESSKAFAKDFMRRHSIPTARHRVATSFAEARAVLNSGEFGDASSTVVIKADGLAAGKGVFVAANRNEGLAAVDDLSRGAAGAEAARRIVIEEALTGPEVSVLLFSDGQDYRLMPAARDHKRIGENDTGPNTGGMGTITDAAIIDPSVLENVTRDIVEPTLKGCRDEGFPFRGILFIGLMLTPAGPKVLEYNVRFGDPEAQSILVRLNTDLAKIFDAMSTGRLGELTIDWSPESSACVVLAARGYPGRPHTGTIIAGIEGAAAHEQVVVFHAATATSGGNFVTAGGRVLGVTATGPRLEVALERCYRAIGEIHWDGMQYRRDIGR